MPIDNKEKTNLSGNEYDFDKQLIDSVRNMSPNQVVNFIQQIYGHVSTSRRPEMGNLRPLFYSCCSILNDNKDDKFANSLKNTLTVFDCDSNKMMDVIKELEPNNLSSFVLLPTASKNHMFATLLYKKNDNEYELITVNKGERNFEKVNHRTYEGYIVTHDEILYFIKNFVYNCECDTVDIYNFLDNNVKKVEYGKSILHNIGINSFSELKSRDQKTGNCFYKDLEAGFRFAWFAAHFENKNKNQSLDNVSITPKGPIDTAEMHNKIVDKLREAAENVYADNKDKYIILTRIDYEKRVYNVNKKFRQYCKAQEQAQSLEIDKIKQGILNIYECENFKNVFIMMDKTSIEKCIDLFKNINCDLGLDNLKLSDLEETVALLEKMKFSSFRMGDINKENTKKIIVDYKNLEKKFTPCIPYALFEGIREFETEIINHNLEYFGKNTSDAFLQLLTIQVIEGEIKNRLDAYINDENKKYEEALQNYKKAYLSNPYRKTVQEYARCLFKNQEPVEALKILNNFLKNPLYERDFNFVVFMMNNYIKQYKYSLDNIKKYVEKADDVDDVVKSYIRASYYENLINRNDQINEDNNVLFNENLSQAFKLNPKFIKAHFRASTSNYDKILEIVSHLIEEEPNNIELKKQYVYCFAYIIQGDDIELDKINNDFNYDELIEKCDEILKYDKYNQEAYSVKRYCISKRIDIINNFIDEFEQIYKDEITSDDIKNIIGEDSQILKKISEYSQSERDEKIKKELVELIEEALAKFYLTKFLKSSGNEYEFDILEYLTNREIVKICNDMVQKGNDSEREEIISEKYEYIKRVKKIEELAKVNYECAEIIIEMAKKSLDKFRKTSNNKDEITSDDIENIIVGDHQILGKISEYSKSERDEKMEGELFELIKEALAKFYLTKFLKSSGDGYEFDMLKYLTPREIVEICNDMVQKDDDYDVSEKQIQIKNKVAKLVKNKMLQDIKEYNIIVVDNEEKIKELLSDDDIVKKVFDYFVKIMNPKDENDKRNGIITIKAVLSEEMKERENGEHWLKQRDINICSVFLEGYTPLTYTIEKGHTDIAKMLIQKGWYVDERDSNGNRPITLALKKFNFKIVYLLIKRKVKCALDKILRGLKLNKTILQNDKFPNKVESYKSKANKVESYKSEANKVKPYKSKANKVELYQIETKKSKIKSKTIE